MTAIPGALTCAALPSVALNVPRFYYSLASATETTPVEGGGLARQVVVGTISGSLVLTRRDGVEVVLSEAVLTALQGVVEREFIALQSDACGDFLVSA